MHKVFFLLVLLFFCLNLNAQELKPKVKKGLYGFSIDNEMVIDYQFDTVEYHFKGKYFVRKDGQWGVVSSDSISTIPCEYASINPWLRNEYLVSNNGLFGIIDSSGRVVWDMIYDEIDHTKRDSVALVKYNGVWALHKNGQFNYNEDEFYFTRPDTMPIFPGCEPGKSDKLYIYLYENIRYPAAGREYGIQGQVIVQFVIDKNGYVRNPKVVRGLGGGLNEESLRVVQNMPQWKPAIQDGKIVQSTFTLPIKYVLR